MEFQFIKSKEELDKVLALEAPVIAPPHVVIYYWYEGSFRKVIRHFAPNKNISHSKLKRLQELYQPKDDYCGLTQQDVFAAFRERFNEQQGWYVADLKNREYFFFTDYQELKNKLKELVTDVS
jgi:hypothetical protein